MKHSATDADPMSDAQLKTELTLLQMSRDAEIEDEAIIVAHRAEMDVRLAATRKSVADMDARIAEIKAQRRHMPSVRRQHRVDDSTTSGGAVTPSAAEHLHDRAHGAKRQAGLTRLLGNGHGHTIKIRVLTRPEDGAAATGAPVAAIELVAHRLVLAAVSEPLNQMIFGAMACVDEENVLTLAGGIEPAALWSVLEYMCSGTLELTQDTMWAVLKACMYLELSGAIDLCTEFLSAQLTPANVFGVLNAAVGLHCAALEAAALDFTTAHMAAVSEGAEWLQMTEEEVSSLARGTHSLSAVVEGWALLEALGRWVEYLPNERRGAFVQCMASEDAMRQNNLGLCYEYGVGVAKDLGTAAAWYTKSAEQGCARGQFHLGRRYYLGEGVAQDFGKAVELYTKAAEQGCARGQNNLGLCYENGKGVAQDLGTAVVCYTKAAEQGYCRAQTNLGICHEEGQGVAQDLGTAVAWYTKAAEQGDAEGQCNLGTCYENGKGVAQDLGTAVVCYTKAAGQGDARAQTNLGICYEEGQGVAQDLGKAVELYTKAAGQGDAGAQNNLGICYEEGQGVAQDLSKAVECYAMAARQGYDEGQYRLGRCYTKGKGVEKDHGKAEEFYLKAAEQGHSGARAMLERIELFCQEHPDAAHLLGR
eukprot:scaffold109176_cov62-Phaeocystis_antarctica.AAC.3